MFDLYRNKQAETITFEYKKDKYGWTEEDFSKYNKSRSVTLENMIKRHGEIDGKAKFDEYCEKQAVNGNTLEYFVSKYGKKDGNKQYEKVCANKSHTYDNYVRLYGEENAEEKLTKFHKGCNGFYSIISQQFFEELTKKI